MTKTILLDSHSRELNAFYRNRIYSFLEVLEDEYPDFQKWYFDKVFDIETLPNSRSIIICEYKSEICAVSILKSGEKKICTFRVAEKFQGLKIGSNLMKNSIEILKTPKPLITVSEDKILQFKKIFSNFDFNLFKEYNNYYNNYKIEYSYNKPIEIMSHNSIIYSQDICNKLKSNLASNIC